MTKQESANHVINVVREKTDECILFCSLGKDSLVLLDLIYPKFNRIVCVFMYFVEGLEHIERWIKWLKSRYPKIEFVQVPHWNLTYVLRGGLFCVAQPKVKLLKLRDVVDAMTIKYQIGHVFLGMKKADSMNRRLMLNTYAAEDYIHQGLVYPLAEWTQKEILSYMKMHNLPEPVRYGKNASNGVGFNEDCFSWLEKNCPQDLEKIYKVFPMSRRILFEYHLRKEKDEQEKQLNEQVNGLQT